MENSENQENESARNPADSKYNLIDIVSQNTKVEIILNLLSQIDWNVIDEMIIATPENLQDQVSYKVLVSSHKFNNEINTIFKGE